MFLEPSTALGAWICCLIIFVISFKTNPIMANICGNDQPCQPGHWCESIAGSADWSQCNPCTTCNDGESLQVPCRFDTDTKCSPTPNKPIDAVHEKSTQIPYGGTADTSSSSVPCNSNHHNTPSPEPIDPVNEGLEPVVVILAVLLICIVVILVLCKRKWIWGKIQLMNRRPQVLNDQNGTGHTVARDEAVTVDIENGGVEDELCAATNEQGVSQNSPLVRELTHVDRHLIEDHE